MVERRICHWPHAGSLMALTLPKANNHFSLAPRRIIDGGPPHCLLDAWPTIDGQRPHLWSCETCVLPLCVVCHCVAPIGPPAHAFVALAQSDLVPL